MKQYRPCVADGGQGLILVESGLAEITKENVGLGAQVPSKCQHKGITVLHVSLI